jgi:Gas vesicle protein G
MDLVSLTVGLPFAPLRGLLAVARLLQDEAEEQLYNPTHVRQELEEIEEARTDRQLSDEAAADATQSVLDRLRPK